MINRRTLLAGLAGGTVAAIVGPAIPAAAVAHPRWNRTTVKVWDRLGTAWPVQVAAEAWDDSSKLDVVRVTAAPSRADSVIEIRTGNLPAGILGNTTLTYDALGRIKWATVIINQSIRMNEFESGRRLALVRHEIGHCLGFRHSRTGRDVMLEQIRRGGPTDLSQFHRDELRATYGA